MNDTVKAKPDLGALQKDLERATEAHAQTVSNTAAANRAEVNALNRLNDAQKALDAAVTTLRKDATHHTNWGRERDRPARPQA